MKNRLLEYDDYPDSRKKKKKIILTIVCVLIAVIVAFAAFVIIKGIVDVKELKAQALNLKEQLKSSISLTQNSDYDNALTALDNADVCLENISRKLDEPYWKAVLNLPIVKKETEGAQELISLAKEASSGLMRPAINFVKDNPLSGLKRNDGFDVYLIMSYVNYAEKAETDLDELLKKADNLKLSPRILKMIDKNGKIDEYKEQLTSFKAQYNDLKGYLPLLKRFLGDREDKLYMLAAQNSSEVRACGGFPGSIGTIRIKNGIMYIGEFKGVTDVLPFSTPDTIKLTQEESKLFDNWLRFPRDAEYNPDFERVAEIWAGSFEKMNKESIDGVISLTPSIIQRILELSGSVTLSDGTVLDGTNATKVLQHDLYNTYFKKTNDQNVVNSTVDSLFSETAKKAMSLFSNNLDIKNIQDYCRIFTDGTADRTILIWMADTQTQEIIRGLGCSGSLKADNQDSVTGVFYSGSDPCKLGWYLDIDTQISDTVLNADGSHTYTIKVSLRNNIDKETISKAGKYIIGNYGGAMKGYVHLFAPENGYISDIEASNNSTFRISEYQGLKVGYSLNMKIFPQKPVELKYKITTARGVTQPLKIITTPTLQKYRTD